MKSDSQWPVSGLLGTGSWYLEYGLSLKYVNRSPSFGNKVVTRGLFECEWGKGVMSVMWCW